MKLHFHNSVLRRFCSISVISEFSYSGVGLKVKTRKSQKIYILQFFLKLYQIRFCVCLSLLLLAEFVIPLLNCYFRDFCGFRDFWVFNLAFEITP